MGIKHPAGLGQQTRNCWPEVWHINGPIYDRVWLGETVYLEDARFPITRSGVLQDAWFTLSYTPCGTPRAWSRAFLLSCSKLQANIWPRRNAGRLRSALSRARRGTAS